MTTATSNSHRYQRWNEQPSRRYWTWLAILTTGVKLANKGTRTRSLIWMNLGFAIGSCSLFYALAQVEILAGTRQAEGLYAFIRTFLGVNLDGASKLAEYREVLWRTAFLFLFKLEVFWVFILAAFAGPGLIADDLKARALPIYFARPVNPRTYLLGKWMVIACFMALAVLAPNLLALLFGTLVTGGLDTLAHTAKLGLDLVVCGLGVMLLGGVLLLALSSMSSDKRYVTVGWVALGLLPTMAQGILTEMLPQYVTGGWLGCISLYGNVNSLAEWWFGLRDAWGHTPLPQEAFRDAFGPPMDPNFPGTVLLIVGLAAAWFCYRRIVRFSRSAANL
jgi:ABC-type transport system involved in multi-copper enzyme maturation permease subunit